MREFTLILALDQRLLGDTIIIEVPWDFVNKLKPFFREEEDVILRSSCGRLYRVLAGSLPRLYEGAGLLHRAMASYLKQFSLN